MLLVEEQKERKKDPYFLLSIYSTMLSSIFLVDILWIRSWHDEPYYFVSIYRWLYLQSIWSSIFNVNIGCSRFCNLILSLVLSMYHSAALFVFLRFSVYLVFIVFCEFYHRWSSFNGSNLVICSVCPATTI